MGALRHIVRYCRVEERRVEESRGEIRKLPDWIGGGEYVALFFGGGVASSVFVRGFVWGDGVLWSVCLSGFIFLNIFFFYWKRSFRGVKK